MHSWSFWISIIRSCGRRWCCVPAFVLVSGNRLSDPLLAARYVDLPFLGNHFRISCFSSLFPYLREGGFELSQPEGAITWLLDAPSWHAPRLKTFVYSPCFFVLMPDGHILFIYGKGVKNLVKVILFPASGFFLSGARPRILAKNPSRQRWPRRLWRPTLLSPDGEVGDLSDSGFSDSFFT